jgi:seryl-tRNA synthetase
LTTPDQTESQRRLLEELEAVRLLIPSGVPGVYGRSATFERIVAGVDHLITRQAAATTDVRVTFPPVMPRRDLERIGYLSSFPHLAGSIFSFEGEEEDALEMEQRAVVGEDWSEFQRRTDLVLVPAACYPAYPAVAGWGPLAPGGVTLDLGGSYVFRNEPSLDPARMQIFRQREMVRFGEPEVVAEWRDTWASLAVELLRPLGLDAAVDVASDPFFGRAGRLLARSQRSQELKFEVQAPIASDEPTAIASFNYHQEHFSSVYDITLASGERAHTACLGFGLERISLALIAAHGTNVEAWPAAVREQLFTSAPGT